jgi:hypothetical protein
MLGCKLSSENVTPEVKSEYETGCDIFDSKTTEYTRLHQQGKCRTDHCLGSRFCLKALRASDSTPEKESEGINVVNKNSMRVPHNSIPPKVIEKIISLKKSDPLIISNFNHFRELLAEHHQIEVAYSTLYRILKDAGINSPKTRRRLKPHRRRKCRPQAGLLLQVDATPYAWFQGDSKR